MKPSDPKSRRDASIVDFATRLLARRNTEKAKFAAENGYFYYPNTYVPPTEPIPAEFHTIDAALLERGFKCISGHDKTPERRFHYFDHIHTRDKQRSIIVSTASSEQYPEKQVMIITPEIFGAPKRDNISVNYSDFMENISAYTDTRLPSDVPPPPPPTSSPQRGRFSNLMRLFR